MKLIIGSHVSFNKEGQLLGCVKEALSYGANTFMYYTGAPQNTNRVVIDKELTKAGMKLMEESGINPSDIIVHAPYIINLANPTSDDFAANFLRQEVNRCKQLGAKYLVLHPGSHVGTGTDLGIKKIIDGLNKVITKDQNVFICLETMAGKGSEVGHTFEQVKEIIDGVSYKDKIRVCMDTCHISDAGYDITDFDTVLDDFDKIIGLDKLACMHINDSKNEKGAKKDRHENFGYGNLGFDNLIKIIYNKRLENIPKILETPYVSVDGDSKERMYPPYKFEIEMIKKKEFNPNLLEEIRDYYK